LGVRSLRPSKRFTNSGLSDLNQINGLKLNMSGPKWTRPENIGSPGSEIGFREATGAAKEIRKKHSPMAALVVPSSSRRAGTGKTLPDPGITRHVAEND